MNTFVGIQHNIKRLFEDSNGGYHARDGLKRDAGLPTCQLTKKRECVTHSLFYLKGIIFSNLIFFSKSNLVNGNTVLILNTPLLCNLTATKVASSSSFT